MKPGPGIVNVRLAALIAATSLFASTAPLLAQPNSGAQSQSPVLKGPITLSPNDYPGTQAPSSQPTAAPGAPQSANPEPAMQPAGTNPGPASPAPSSNNLDNLDATHAQNSVLDLNQLRLDSSFKPEQFQPIRLEVSFDQLITLREALRYALENNLAVKISKDSLNYQRYVLYGQIANALPNLTMAYNLTHTDIMNEKTTSLAKVFLTRVTYPVFQGGTVAYSILGQYYRERGWKQAYKASVHDEFLDLYQKYNNLILSRALLQIRGKAVDVSTTQLKINNDMEKQGTGTRFAVLQADAQLSSDKQALLQQEVAVRQAALALNFSMNAPMAVNLIPAEETVSEQAIFPEAASIDALVNLALLNRPELREYEDFKVAAGRNIQVAAAPLYPQASFFTQFSYTNTQSKTSATGTGGTDTAGAGVFGGVFDTYQQGFALVWSLSNFGLTSVANLFAAGSLDRQARIQANQELQTIIQQVRSDYLNWRAAREQIDNAAHSVRASQEELRLAILRKNVEVTTELEVIQAERDYINSLSSQATAIVNSNLAQAQLLHDVGLISQDTLLNGYRGKI